MFVAHCVLLATLPSLTKKNQIISMLSFLSPVLSHDQPFHEGSAIGKDAAFYFMSGA
jgi:hypothetical protein